MQIEFISLSSHRDALAAIIENGGKITLIDNPQGISILVETARDSVTAQALTVSEAVEAAVREFSEEQPGVEAGSGKE